MYRWVDLSHPLQAGAPRRPGTRPPAVRTVTATSPAGVAFTTVELTFTSHQGTHLDLKGSPPVETTWGFACVFDLTSRGPDYTQHDLEACDPGGRRDEVFLLWTGRSEPAFCPEAMLWLRDRAPRAVGIDAGGFAPGASHQARDAVLMDAGILVIENVTNLHSLPPRGAEVFFFPLDVPGADAAPVRMVARLPVPSPL